MGEHLTHAMLESIIESRDFDIVVSRFTTWSTCSDRIKQAIFDSPKLHDRIQEVHDARCEISPECANGAVILVPLPRDDVREANLQEFNIVHYRKDFADINKAINNIPKRQNR